MRYQIKYGADLIKCAPSGGVLSISDHMKYQLVLQFPGASLTDFDSLVALEGELARVLEPEHEVDGHDWGSGEMNIFIHSDEPRAAFDAAHRLISTDLHPSLRAAYRNIEGET